MASWSSSAPGEMSSALSKLLQATRRRAAEILATPCLTQFLSSALRTNTSSPMQREVLAALAYLVLRRGNGFREIDVSLIDCSEEHPVPKGSIDNHVTRAWKSELAKLLVLHERSLLGRPYCIGVASVPGFAGKGIEGYGDRSARAFPLVGTDFEGSLASAFEWKLARGSRNRSVRFADVLRNVTQVGANQPIRPSNGSHWKVTIPGTERPWILDRNHDPIPRRELKELASLVRMPLDVLVEALCTGRVPERKLRVGANPEASAAK